MYANCDRPIVLRICSPEWAEVIYDGEGNPNGRQRANPQKNGQRTVSLATVLIFDAG
jgi:hypothetical protein